MDNQDTRAAREYHDGTKHPGGRLMNPHHRFHPAQQPLLFKIYKDLPTIPLPHDHAASQISPVAALDAIRGEIPIPAEETVPDLPALARVLHYSAGITKTIHYPEPWGAIPFRAAACTGALYHIELYLVCGDLPDLAAGVYHFDPQMSVLRQLREGDYRGILVSASGNEPAIRSAPATLVLTDVVWRNAVKYQAREYRHAFWDSGTILANMLAMTASLQLRHRVVLGFVDAEISRLLDLQAEKELVLALIPLGSAPESAPPPPAAVRQLNLEIEAYSRYELDFPPIRAMHAASSLPDGEAVATWREGRMTEDQGRKTEDEGRLTDVHRRKTKDAWKKDEAGAGPEQPAPPGLLAKLQPIPDKRLPSDPIESVIVRRGSTRRFAREAISLEQLSTLLTRSLQDFDADFYDQQNLRLTEAYLIVNAVDGLAPGTYFYRRDLQALEALKPGDVREIAGFLALHQDLAADASVDIFFLADLEPILESLGNRGYRAAQLDAAISAGRIYLAAYALGIGASGLTFFDDAVVDFFSPSAAGKSVMFLIAMGKKRRKS
jgi:SagB-type dehydrogenase family enzyme